MPDPSGRPLRVAALQRRPEWAEIELRLRYGMAPYAVCQWFAERYPDRAPLRHQQLYGFLSEKPASWFLGRQLLAEIHGAPRLLVIQEQVEMILVTKQRIANALKTEQTLAGFMLPEIREMTLLLARLLMDHHRVQQDMGLEPKRLWALTEEEGGDGTDGGTAMLIERIVKLPSPEFLTTMRALGFGPKPEPRWVGSGPGTPVGDPERNGHAEPDAPDRD